MLEINALRKDSFCPFLWQQGIRVHVSGIFVNWLQIICRIFLCPCYGITGKNRRKRRIETLSAEKDIIKILWLELKPYFRKIDFLTKLEEEQGVRIVLRKPIVLLG
ncbi:MAG: hypothetical protein IPI25_00030 [Candidatus Brocadia sp.]|nr:MAG: hypothetical protein IPI25_00030 [Candidatus Brocadia sp.]